MGMVMAHNPAKRLQVVPAEIGHGPAQLFYGRDQELQQLESACLDEHTRVVNLLAPAGTGKTTLLYGWLAHCNTIDWLGADYVFAWCFPSTPPTSSTQSTAAVQAMLADFLYEALLWLGGQPEGLCCAEQAEVLALYLQQPGGFLILDNLPPAFAQIKQADYAELYASEDHPDKSDNALFAVYHLLVQVANRPATDKPGICVLAGEQLPLFKAANEGCVQTLGLGNLPASAGVQLLRAKGVSGSSAELTSISAQFGHHPLALTLLANYLQEACAEDPTPLDPLPSGQLDELYAFLQVPAVMHRLRGVNRSNGGHGQRRLEGLNLLSPPANSAIFDGHALVCSYFYQQLKTRFQPDCQHTGKLEKLEKLAAGHPSHNAAGIPVADIPLADHRPSIGKHSEFDPEFDPELEQDLLAIELQIRQDKAVAEKNWPLASVLAGRLYEQYLFMLELSSAMLCLRQSAAYAYLAQDQATVRHSLQLLRNLQRQCGMKHAS